MAHRKNLISRAVILCGLTVFAAFFALSAFFDPDGIVSQLIELTHIEWEKPSAFGIFHILMLSACVTFGVLAVFVGRKLDNDRLDSLVFSAGTVLLLMEVYKQIYYHTVIGNGHYNFSILPLQVCSYSLYCYLLIPLLPEGKLKDLLFDFSALYLTMGGCLVMAYPSFYPDLSLCLHTMIWHTVMIFTGICILLTRSFRKSYLRTLLSATTVFMCTVAVAVTLNFLLTPLTENSAAPLNLFYMSPYQTNNYFIISDVREHFGWLPAMITYVMLFIFVGANTVWGTGWLILRLFDLKNHKNHGKNNSLT